VQEDPVIRQFKRFRHLVEMMETMKKNNKDLKWERVEDTFQVAIKGFALFGERVCWDC
jgi:hypothetical protein